MLLLVDHYEPGLNRVLARLREVEPVVDDGLVLLGAIGRECLDEAITARRRRRVDPASRTPLSIRHLEVDRLIDTADERERRARLSRIGDAESRDDNLARGMPVGLLHGLPLAIKDLA